MLRAAEQGDAKACNNLGWLLTEGEGIEHDPAKAAYWLGKAAGAGLPVAMAQLGDIYREGLTGAPDTLRALTLYEDAIHSGLADAQLKLLSMMYPRFRRLPTDSLAPEARRYLRLGAPGVAVALMKIGSERDDPTSMALLANAYSRGEGVGYSHAESLRYFFRAAMGGNASAQFVLGELLELFPDALKDLPRELRERVTPEMATAGYWLGKAAEGGIRDAESATGALIFGELP